MVKSGLGFGDEKLRSHLIMNLLCYFHPVRTFLPCSGAGRFINNVLLELAKKDDVNLELLYSQEWLKMDGRLPENAPLRDLPFHSFPSRENRTERLWKMLQRPRMDSFVPSKTDWVYCPVETLFPIRGNTPVAITIYDIQAFEPDLPWSGSREHRFFAWKWGRWVRASIDRCQLVFTISEFTKSRMVELLSVSPEKVINVGCGVESAFFNTQADPHSASPYICMVGGLRHKKGGAHYLALAKELLDRKSPIRLVVAGPNDPDLEELALALPNLELPGMVPDIDLPGLVSHSLAMVFLSEYEGFGIPPLEAMAAGVPAMVSNRASLPEVVGGAGEVVEPEQTGEIVDWLERLLTDDAFRMHYIEKGKQHVRQYTWQRCAENVFNALEQGR
jgi:glycosyltransferase involved in cell wall biosynthesis